MTGLILFPAAIAALHAIAPDTPKEQAAPVGGPTVRATAGQLFGLAEEMVRRGNPEQAEPIYDLLARDPNPDVRNEARYRTALMLAARSQNRSAAVLLRQILDEKPEAAAVRLQLATTLQKLGDEDAALRELRAMRSASLPLNVARFVDRLSASLQATKPFGVQVEFALAPDSNINRATHSDTLGTILGDFTVDEETKAKSGLGASVRTMAQVRSPLSDSINLIGRASGEANLYRDHKFNDIALELSAGGELKLGRTRLSAEAGVGQQWYGMEPSQRSVRLSGTISRPAGPVSQLRLDASARWLNNGINDLEDGRGFSARLYYERALAPRLLLSASIGGDRFKARDDAYSTKSWRAGITAYREIGRMTGYAGAEFGRLKADERLILFPEARADEFRRIQLGAVYRQFTFAGFAPTTRLVIERNRSSIEFYDYKRTRVEFGVSRAF